MKKTCTKDETRKFWGIKKGKGKKVGDSKWENGVGKKLKGCEKRSFGNTGQNVSTVGYFIVGHVLVLSFNSEILVSVFTPPNYVIHGCIARKKERNSSSTFSKREKGQENPRKEARTSFRMKYG